MNRKRRLAEMLVQSREAANETGERLKQVEDLAEQVTRSAAIKDELVRSWPAYRRVSATSASQADAADDHLKRLETTSKQLEQRRSQFAFAEKRIAAFEGRLDDLRPSPRSSKARSKPCHSGRRSSRRCERKSRRCTRSARAPGPTSSTPRSTAPAWRRCVNASTASSR